MELIRKLWVKGKWYMLAILIALTLVFGVVFRQGKGSPAEKLLKTVFEGQKKLVEREVSRKKAKEEIVDKKIEEVDKKLQQIDKRVADKNAAVDTMDLKELADAWKELGL